MKVSFSSILILSTVFFAGCQTGGIAQYTGAGHNTLMIPTEKVRYERTGGGNLEFIIQRKDVAYEIKVVKHNFKEALLAYVLTQEEVGDRAATMLDQLFDGTISLSLPGNSSGGDRLPTGTWNEVYIFSGYWKHVKNTHVADTLRSLEDGVRKRVEKSEAEQEVLR